MREILSDRNLLKLPGSGSVLPLVLALSVVTGITGRISQALGQVASGVPCRAGAPEYTKIHILERAVAAFFEDVLANMDEFVESEDMQDRLASAAKIFEANRDNVGRCTPGGDVPFGTETGFSYTFVPGMKDFAKFDGLHRVLYLRQDFNPENEVHLAQVVHELTHVSQDDEIRSSGKVLWEQYVAFWRASEDGSVAVLAHEIDANARASEALNVKMRGELSLVVRSGACMAPGTGDAEAQRFAYGMAREYFGSPGTFSDNVARVYGGAQWFTTSLMPISHDAQ